MEHCKKESTKTNSVSRLPYLSSENKAYLNSEAIGIETIDDVMTKMSTPKAQQQLMVNSGSLKAKGQRLYNLAKSLQEKDNPSWK